MNALEAALHAIAARCDGAVALDGRGFNGHDTKFGRRIAAEPEPTWPDDVRYEVYRMLRTYRGQLADAGIDYDAIDEPPKPAHEAEFSSTAREWARQAERAAARRAERASMTKRLDLVGDVFVVSTSAYDAEIVEAVKAIPGRRWDGKANVLPLSSRSVVAVFAEAFGFDVSPAARAALDDSAPLPEAPPNITLDGERFVVSFDYDQYLVTQMKAAGGRWEKTRRVWILPAAAGAALIGVTDAGYALSWAPEARTAAERSIETAAALRDGSRAAEADVEVPGLGGELLPFQRAGVAYMLRTRRCFNADEMGLGKTVQALAALEAAGAFPAVVVCPSSLKLNWAREASIWLPHRSVQVLVGRNGFRPEGADLTIVNYDILPDHVERLGARIRGLVADESHYAKNPKAKRTKALRTLAKKVPADGVVFLLSGTPLVNRPIELSSQLGVLDRLDDDFGGFWGFARRYCGAYNNGYGWDFSGATNLPELNEHLRSTCYVRRLKADVLAELPAKRRAELSIEGDAKALAEYRRIEADVVGEVAARAAEIAEEIGEDVESAAVAARLAAEAAEHLVRIAVLRRAAVDVKIAGVEAWLADFLDGGKKVVVVAHHRNVVDRLAERYHAPKIQGGMTGAEVEKAKARFQDDPECRVIVLNIQAGGVGHTLTAASDVLFVEMGWTPGEHSQAEDRCHRIGQHDSVTAWYSVAAGTIDEEMLALLDQKRTVVDAATEGGDVRTGPSIAGALLGSLARRGLSQIAVAS